MNLSHIAVVALLVLAGCISHGADPPPLTSTQSNTPAPDSDPPEPLAAAGATSARGQVWRPGTDAVTGAFSFNVTGVAQCDITTFFRTKPVEGAGSVLLVSPPAGDTPYVRVGEYTNGAQLRVAGAPTQPLVGAVDDVMANAPEALFPAGLENINTMTLNGTMTIRFTANSLDGTASDGTPIEILKIACDSDVYFSDYKEASSSTLVNLVTANHATGAKVATKGAMIQEGSWQLAPEDSRQEVVLVWYKYSGKATVTIGGNASEITLAAPGVQNLVMAGPNARLEIMDAQPERGASLTFLGGSLATLHDAMWPTSWQTVTSAPPE